jgi:hypothetical protein
VLVSWLLVVELYMHCRLQPAALLPASRGQGGVSCVISSVGRDRKTVNYITGNKFCVTY